MANLNLLEALFNTNDLLKIDELLSQIVKAASEDPDTWREALPPAIVEAEKRYQEANEVSVKVKLHAIATVRAKAEGADVSDMQLLEAKAASFDADEISVNWLTVEGDLRDLYSELSKAAPITREYVQ